MDFYLENDFVNCKNTMIEIIEKIKKNEKGFYIRFGDGDFNLSQNMNDMLAVCNNDIKNSINHTMSIRDERVMISIPHHCKLYNTIEEGMYPGNHEYPDEMVINFLKILKENKSSFPKKIYTNVALSYCSYHCPEIVLKLHSEIKKCNAIFIGNYKYSDEFLYKLFGKSVYRINTNDNNAYNQHDKVFSELHDYITNKNINQYFIIILAAGCASRAFCSEIYDKYFSSHSFFVFDYGSLLDYLYGMNTRAYMDIQPPKKQYILENIDSNLCSYKNLVLIPSIICTPDIPLSYTNKRSVYSRKERFEQTKKTICSIRNNLPNSIIFIIECSLLEKEEREYFIEKADIFINLFDLGNKNMIDCIYSPSKSLGEAIFLINGIKHLIENNIEFDNFYKISGRYWLSSNFQYEKFDNTDIVVKKINGDINNLLTSFYKLPKNKINLWLDFLLNSKTELQNCIGAEVLFAKFINTQNTDLKTNVVFVDKLGISGNIAVSGDFIDE
jgi:hypothetical protein